MENSLHFNNNLMNENIPNFQNKALKYKNLRFV